MNLKQMLAPQELAGKNFQVCVDQLYAAYIELAAPDAALACSNCADVRTFAHLSQDLRPFDHPIYAPLKVPDDWRETIAARRDRLINEFDDRPVFARRAANA
jgi:hypothetical protein